MGIHKPKDRDEADFARRRFIFDDFFYLQVSLLLSAHLLCFIKSVKHIQKVVVIVLASCLARARLYLNPGMCAGVCMVSLCVCFLKAMGLCVRYGYFSLSTYFLMQ